MPSLKRLALSLVIVLTTLLSVPNALATCEPVPKDSSLWGDVVDAFIDFLCPSLNPFCDHPPTIKASPNINSSYSIGDNIDYDFTVEDDEGLSQACIHVFYQDDDPDTLQDETKWTISGTSISKSDSFSTEGWDSGQYYYQLWVYDNYDGFFEPKPQYSYDDGSFELTDSILEEETEETSEESDETLSEEETEEIPEESDETLSDEEETEEISEESDETLSEKEETETTGEETTIPNEETSEDIESEEDILDTVLDDILPTDPISTLLKTGLGAIKNIAQNSIPGFNINTPSNKSLCVSKSGKPASSIGCLEGDPIDTATGAQIIQYTLLSVQGVLPISFTLSYNSLLLEKGKAGKGWGLNSLGARLENGSDDTIKIHWSDNQWNEFTLNDNGEYRSSALSARFDRLVKNDDGSFTLTRSNQTIYEFSVDGQLATLRNDRGQSLSLTYDEDGQLTQITEPVSGVFLRYAYNADDLIETVSDSLDRQVQLGYDEQQRLTSITDAAEQTTTYTYNKDGQILTAVTSEGITLFTNTYDDQGRVISQEDGIKSNELLRLSYDESQDNQIITTVTDRTGETRIYTYDDNYQLLSIKDELGQSIRFVYDANGNRTSVTDANDITTQFAYDDNGNVIQITDAAENVTQLTYDDNNNLLSLTNALEKTTRFSYDNNNLVSITDALDNSSQYAYNDAGQILTVTSPNDVVTIYEYDKGLLVKVIDPENHAQTLGYDAAGRLITITDAENNTTTLTYDAVNRLNKVTDALDRKVSMTYDSQGHLLTFTDAKGHLTKRRYDGNGNLISQTNALEQETRYEYDGEDRLLKVIDAKNQVTQLHYDPKGRLIRITDPLKHTRQLTYDAADNVLSQMDALGNTVATFQYDALNNLSSITDALQNTSELKYDVLSRLTEVIDPLKNVTQFQYDDVDRFVSSLDAEAGQSSQAFDDNGNLTSLTDPNTNKTGFTFDKNGRLIEEQSAAGGSVRYTYNARDLLVEITNAREQKRELEYDVVGRLIRLTDVEGEITYTYDDNDNVLTVTDANGSLTREYDALDRVIKYTDNQDNTLLYAYDEVGNLVTLTYPDNKQVSYEYNEAGQLVKVIDWAQRETQYEYDANGRLVNVKRPNGTQMTRHYDEAGQLLQQQDKDSQGEILSLFDFTYNQAGDIIEEAMLPEPEPFPLASVNMTYTAANRLKTFNDEPVTFDADGNMTQGPLNGERVDFAFDSRNRLNSVGAIAYRYNAENQRIGVSVNEAETGYVINPQAALSQVLVRTAPDGKKTFYVYGLGLIGEETDGEYQAYHFDLRGSTVALTDTTGNVVERFAYSPYGGLVSEQSPAEIDTPFLFNGMYGVMTDDTGLYYMRARYYNPEIRRFVNQDPLMLGFVAQGQTLNRYAYVTGEPVSYVDPFGLCEEDPYFIEGAPWYWNAAILGLDVVDYGSDIAYVASLFGSGGTSSAALPVVVLKKTTLKTIKKELKKELKENVKKTISLNQLSKKIQSRKGVPSDILRVDKGSPRHGEKPHIHFRNGAALNKDGTWKHIPKELTNKIKLTNKEKKWLQENGWELPE
jgi:RHS repeat-associated protein